MTDDPNAGIKQLRDRLLEDPPPSREELDQFVMVDTLGRMAQFNWDLVTPREATEAITIYLEMMGDGQLRH